MKWTLEMEEMLLQLYVEVKTIYNKMKKDTERYRWIAKKLGEEKFQVSWKQVKDKLAAVKKVGNKKLKEFVLPHVRRTEKTGSAVDDDAPLNDDGLDWEDIMKRAKWPLLKIYFTVFKNHPTLGIAFGADTADSSSESDAPVAADERAGSPVGHPHVALQVQVGDEYSDTDSDGRDSEEDSDSSDHQESEDSDLVPLTPPPVQQPAQQAPAPPVAAAPAAAPALQPAVAAAAAPQPVQ